MDTMPIIYEPKGKAREYSPLALNIYKGCDHDCNYCYCKDMIFLKHTNLVTERPNLLKQLSKELEKQITKQVLLSFISDPYCKANDKLKLTRSVLMKLYFKNVPVAILTKGGNRALQDIDLIAKFKSIKIGATLTLNNADDSCKIESGSSLPCERLKMLKSFHDKNVRTWVSIEPVIYPKQSLDMIERSLDFVDEYKIGKLNHNANNTDWHKFLVDSVTLLRKNNKQFYVKNDLAKFANGFELTANERDMDHLTLKSNSVKQLSIL
jgi:DNA repair photolyase